MYLNLYLYDLSYSMYFVTLAFSRLINLFLEMFFPSIISKNSASFNRKVDFMELNLH